MTAVLSLITVIAETTNELLKKLPDYDQKLRADWEHIYNLYIQELKKPRHDWDADLLLNIRSKILIHNKEALKVSQNG